MSAARQPGGATQVGPDAAVATGPAEGPLGSGLELPLPLLQRRSRGAEHPLAWVIITCTIVGMVLAVADQMIVGTAMPRIAAELSGFDRYSWVTTAYMLGLTVTVPLYGKLADLYDAKVVFLFGLLLFVGASAACGLAGTMNELIACRAVQGIGAGALTPVGIVVLGAFVTPRRRPALQGAVGSLVLAATVAGPIVGGWLTDHGTWRSVFFVNVPLGLAVAALLAVMLPPLRINPKRVHLDVAGAVLLAAGMLPILLAVSVPAAQRTFLVNGRAWPLLVAGIAILAGFAYQELRHAEPIIDPRLVTRLRFAVPSVGIMALSAILFSGLIYIPLYTQGVLGNTATRGGLVLAPMLLSSISGRLVITWLQQHHGRERAALILSLGLVFASAGLLCTLHNGSAALMVLVALVGLGAGLGAANAVLHGAAMSVFPLRKFGQVTATLFFLRSLAATFAVGALSGLLTSRFAAAVVADMPHRLRWLLHTRFAAQLYNPRLLLLRLDIPIKGGHPVLRVAHFVLRVALASSLHEVFVATAAVAGLAFVAVGFFPLSLRERPGEGAAILAASGDLVLDDGAEGSAPSTAEAVSAWEIVSRILLWRHSSAVEGSDSGGAARAFNQFESATALPSSLEDTALAGAFERVWAIVRERASIDRYRAESIASLLWRTRDVPGDVAICGAAGEGLPLLLALLVRELALQGRVWLYDGTDNRDTPADETALSPAGSEPTEQHNLRAMPDILTIVPGRFVHVLAAIPPEQRFRLIYIFGDMYSAAGPCTKHMLPRAGNGAAVVFGHYHGSREGARRAASESPLLSGRIVAGPLPQAHVMVEASGADGSSASPAPVDWSELRENDAYRKFLHWAGAEVAACYQSAGTSPRDARIVDALEKLGLPERADAYLSRFIALI